MKAKYDFRLAPNPQDSNGSRILYPKLVPQGTLTWEQMVEEIASHSSFDRGVLVGAMAEIERCALYHLSHGERVQIGGICYAEATLEAEREVESESAVHAQSIRFGKVRLQPMKNFRPHGQLERAEHHRKFRESSGELTEEERLVRLKEYLSRHESITRTQYGELTGLLRSKAQRDLNRWVEDGVLVQQGRAPHRVYLLDCQR